MAYFLFKSEPEDYSLDDLEKAGSVRWDSIRNYGARNRLQECRPGDDVLFYHSGRKPAVVGLARVSSDPYPDPTQFDESSDYYDAKSKPDAPRWFSVDIDFVEVFSTPVSLAQMKSAEALADLEVVNRQRLSVSNVTDAQYAWITERARK